MKFWYRKAKIPQDQRDVFERFGPDVIGSVLINGHAPRHQLLHPLYNRNPPDIEDHALEWLTEQHHRTERKENWSLVMEISITAFVFGELVLGLNEHVFHWWK